MTKDYTEAAKWYRKAAEQNYDEAQFHLGRFYANGLGVVKNDEEATKWFRKAAEQNYAPAKVFLGIHYANGQGVARDVVEAYAWLNLAAEKEELAVKYRNTLMKKMSPQQVADAEKRTKELRAEIEANLKRGIK